MNWPTKRTEQYPTPWESGDLYRSFNNLLEDFFGRSLIDAPAGGINPRFEVSETEKEIWVEAELPGMNEKDIDLTLQENVLTIKGEKKCEENTEKKNYYIAERSYGHFKRSFRLGSDVDTENVDASFKNGILTIRIPKLEPEKSKARTISIKAE